MFRLPFGLVHVGGRVPLEDQLDRVRAKAPQAFVGPAVGRVRHKVAELAYGALVVAQGGADAAVSLVGQLIPGSGLATRTGVAYSHPMQLAAVGTMEPWLAPRLILMPVGLLAFSGLPRASAGCRATV